MRIISTGEAPGSFAMFLLFLLRFPAAAKIASTKIKA
jgi:hypothetical protein